METVDDQQAYEILRNLSSPMVAITCRRGEKRNGLIVNSVVRASLVPGRQRVANYVFKRHLSHEIIAATGRYALHLLSRDQWDEIWALGFQSGREADKLEQVPHRLSDETGLPLLLRAYAWMECEVVNVMDAGSSTFFMGEIQRIGRGRGDELMDSDHFRSNMPEDWHEEYLENLREVQRWADEYEAEMDDRIWRELHRKVTEGGEQESET
jgi:flavin reductase (DIM6/NTAB) family NADH-FMN oxidoreductase RutF